MTGSPGGIRRSGVVAEFDETAGLGTILGDDDVPYQFHCVAVADGSRTIEVGARVTFDLLPKLGRYEAARIGP